MRVLLLILLFCSLTTVEARTARRSGLCARLLAACSTLGLGGCSYTSWHQYRSGPGGVESRSETHFEFLTDDRDEELRRYRDAQERQAILEDIHRLRESLYPSRQLEVQEVRAQLVVSYEINESDGEYLAAELEKARHLPFYLPGRNSLKMPFHDLWRDQVLRPDVPGNEYVLTPGLVEVIEEPAVMGIAQVRAYMEITFRYRDPFFVVNTIQALERRNHPEITFRVRGVPQ